MLAMSYICSRNCHYSHYIPLHRRSMANNTSISLTSRHSCNSALLEIQGRGGYSYEGWAIVIVDFSSVRSTMTDVQFVILLVDLFMYPANVHRRHLLSLDLRAGA